MFKYKSILQVADLRLHVVKLHDPAANLLMKMFVLESDS